MTKATENLTCLYWQYRAAWQVAQQDPGDASSLAAMHSAADVFASAAFQVMQQMAKTIMKGQAIGRDIANPKELALVVYSKRFLDHPIFPKFECDTTAPCEGQAGIEGYLYRVLSNEYLDDWRRLHGRTQATPTEPTKPSESAEPTEPSEPSDSAQPGDQAGADEGDSVAQKPKEERVPRIYVNIDDLGVANEVTGITSDRRTQSGYYALQQTRHYLEIYLRQIPGSIVSVPKKAADPLLGMKRVKLTQGHAVLLRVWMAGDGLQGWKEIAQELGRPEGTVKRWFSEVAKHFKTDTSADAVALRSLYAVKDSAIPEYDEEPDEATPSGSNSTSCDTA